MNNGQCEPQGTTIKANQAYRVNDVRSQMPSSTPVPQSPLIEFENELAGQCDTARNIRNRLQSLLVQLRGVIPESVNNGLKSPEPDSSSHFSRVRGANNILRGYQHETQMMLCELETIAGL